MVKGSSNQPRQGHTVEGTVSEALPNDMFVVTLDNGRRVMSHVPGEVRTRIVRIVPGDRVSVALSPYDLSRGRILGLI